MNTTPLFALSTLAAAVLLSGCGGGQSGDRATAQAEATLADGTAAANSALWRSQNPTGQTVDVQLNDREGPINATLKDGTLFLGDVAIGQVHGERVLGAQGQLLVDLNPGRKQAQNAQPLGSGIVNANNQKWPAGVIPYVFDPGATQATRDAFDGAKRDYDAKTSIRWVPRTNQANYVRVITGSGCYSYVGTIGGAQDLSLGAGCGVNPARHEMGHALGLAHEQVRQDRDQFVNVNLDLTGAGRSQYEIDRGSAGTPIGPYDFESMMHYLNYQVNGRWIFEPKTGFPPDRIGNNNVNTFTPGDLAAIQAIYGGTAPPPPPPSPPPPPPPPAPSPPPSTSALTLMPLGDSITAGVGSSSNSSYRNTLWTKLNCQGQGSKLNFVGSQRSGTLPDPDNEGHSGFRIDEIAALTTGALATYRPNVVTLHIGTNDMDRDFDVANAPGRLGSLIDQILDNDPGVVVVVASLVPTRKAAGAARVAEFNRQVPGLVQQRQNAGKHVVYVSMDSVTTADLSDDLHPNDTGYRKMARVFDSGIEAARVKGWLAIPAPTNLASCAINDPAPVPVSAISPLRMADFDGDGKADYMVVASDSSVRVWINKGGDTATTAGWVGLGKVASGVGVPGSQIRFADFDGDGKADYWVVGDDGSVQVWLNKGGDTAAGPGWVGLGKVATGTGAPGSQVRIADFDGDGKADYWVVGGDGSVQIWLNKGGDTAAGPGWVGLGKVATGTGAPGSQVRIADFDGDGKADYWVVGDDGSVQVWLNKGGDTAAGPGWVGLGKVATGTGAPGRQVQLADINGDRKADYLVVGANGSVNAWLNAGGDTAGGPGWVPKGQIATGVSGFGQP